MINIYLSYPNKSYGKYVVCGLFIENNTDSDFYFKGVVNGTRIPPPGAPYGYEKVDKGKTAYMSIALPFPSKLAVKIEDNNGNLIFDKEVVVGKIYESLMAGILGFALGIIVCKLVS